MRGLKSHGRRVVFSQEEKTFSREEHENFLTAGEVSTLTVGRRQLPMI